jgi:hypothetical protein
MKRGCHALDAKNGCSHPAQIMKKPRRGGRGFFGSSGEQRDGREAVTSSGIALGELRTTPSIMNILS